MTGREVVIIYLLYFVSAQHKLTKYWRLSLLASRILTKPVQQSIYQFCYRDLTKGLEFKTKTLISDLKININTFNDFDT